MTGIPIDAPSLPEAVPELIVNGAIDCGTVGCGMALIGSRIFAANADGQIIAIDTPAGTTAWTNELGPRDSKPSIFAQGSLVVIASTAPSGRRYQAIDPESGAIVWERTFGQAERSLFLEQDSRADTLILALPVDKGGLGSVSAFERGNGQLRWSVEGRIITNDVDRIYVAGEDEIVAVNRADGEALWTTPVATTARSENNALPRGAIAGDRLVVTTDNLVVGLDTATGRPVWRQGLTADAAPTANTGTVSPLASTPGTRVADVVVVSGPSADMALNAADGSPRWFERRANLLGDDNDRSVWVASPGLFTVGRSDGVVTTYSAEDGSVVGSSSVGEVIGYSLYENGVLAITADSVVAVRRESGDTGWQVDDVDGTQVVAAANGFAVAGQNGVGLYRS